MERAERERRENREREPDRDAKRLHAARLPLSGVPPGGARRDVGLPHGRQDEDERLAVGVGGGGRPGSPRRASCCGGPTRRGRPGGRPGRRRPCPRRRECRSARRARSSARTRPTRLPFRRPSRRPRVRARRVREEDAHRGRLVGEELDARRPRAEGDDASEEPARRDDDAVELEAVGRAPVEERGPEGPARLDGDEARRDRAGRRRRLRAEELEEASLVVLGVAQAEELAAEPLDLGGQRAVLDAERAPRHRPGPDVVGARAHGR